MFKRAVIFILLILFFITCKRGSKLSTEFSNRDSIEVLTPTGVNKPNFFVGGEKFENEIAEDLNSQGIELIKTGEYLKAESKFKKALAHEPTNPTILNNLGNFNDYMAYKSEALEYYKKAVFYSDSTYFNAVYNLGRMQCKLGNYEKSEKIINFAIENFEEIEFQSISNYLLANVYLEVKNCGEAKKALNKAKSYYENNIEMKVSYKKLNTKIQNCTSKSN